MLRIQRYIIACPMEANGLILRREIVFKWLKKILKIKPYYFALKGDEVTCENGHVICEVAENIKLGDMHKTSHFTRWRQSKPQPYDTEDKVKCGVCGAKYWHGFEGQHFHFSDGWRMRPPVIGAENAIKTARK